MKSQSNGETRLLEEPLQALKIKGRGTILDAIAEHIVVQDTDMRVVWANKAAGDSVGSDTRDLVGRHCYEVWQGRSEPCEGCPVRTALITGRPHEGEIKTPDGRHWVIKGYPVRDRDDNIINAVEITMDVTDRKRTETELLESEGQYRGLVQQSLQGIVIFQDCRVVFSNTPVGRMVGHSVDELENLEAESLKALLHPEDREIVWERALARMAGDEVTQHYEFRAFTKDGSISWLELDAKPITHKGRPAVQGVISDITERKRAEQALQESEERYSNLFQHSNDAIFMHDLEGNIIDVNQKTLRLFGYSKPEILAMRIPDLHPANAVEKSHFAFDRIARDGFVSFEIDFVRKGGEVFPAEVSSSLFEIQGIPVIQGIVRDITERRGVEQALRRSEAQHRSLVENINEIIFTLDNQGRFTYISPVVERVLGYGQAEIAGRPFNCFVHPDDAAGLLVAFEQSLGDNPKTHEFRVLAKDGTTHFARISCRPLADDDRLAGLTGIMADITESKMASAVLKESEEMYETLVRTTTDAVTVTDLQGNITDVSGRTLQLHGSDRPEDLVGRSAFELIAPHDHKRALANLKKTLKEGYLRSVEYTFIRKDGSHFIGELDAAVVKDARGNPKGFIATTKDITERKRAQHALQRSEQRFRDIAEHASEWIWEVDAQGIYTYSSPVIKKILGYEPEEILGKHFYDLFPPEGREEMKEAVFDVFAKKQPFNEYVNLNIHKDGREVWLSTSGVPILDDDGHLLGYRGADTDITEIRHAEEQLATEREQLVRTLRAIRDGLIATDISGRIVILNKAAEDLTGWPESQAIGRQLNRVFRVTAGETTTSLPDIVHAAMAVDGDSSLTGQATLTAQDGSALRVGYTAGKIRNSSNELSGIVVVFNTIADPGK